MFSFIQPILKLVKPDKFTIDNLVFFLNHKVSFWHLTVNAY